MAFQAKVTLLAEHDSVKPVERILILDAATRVVLIGRASKSITKGLFSAADNAWFDSPVMSRDHAKLTLNTDDNIVSIQDIGSMHGTYLNGTELAHHAPAVLKNGDVIVFGAEVRRGPETFPACSFLVGVDFIEPMSTGTFAFPESSDIEEEEDQEDGAEDDYNFSEDDTTGRQQQSSEDGASIESQAPNAQKFDDAIDLTGDDSPEESNRIDLTGETPSERALLEVLAGRPMDLDDRAHSVSIGIYAGNAPILVESEDEESDNASIDAAEQSENGFSDSDSSEDYNSRLDNDIFPGSEESEAESEVDDMVIEDSYDAESAHGLSNVEDREEAPRVNSFTRYAQAHDNSTILLSDIRTRTQLPQSVAEDEDEDSESEFGLSEAGEAGLRALIDGGLLQNGNASSDNDQDSESESEPDSESNNLSESVSPAPLKVTANISSQSNGSSNLPCVASTARFATLQNFTGHNLAPSPAIRLPSPSDAAMVKSPTASQQSRELIGTSELGSFGISTAQILGDKTGKTAFFEAREANKAKIDAEAKYTKLGYNTLTNSTNLPGFGQSKSQTINNAGSVSPRNTKTATSLEPAFPVFPIRETCTFLDKPDQTRIPTRTSSPQLDMTSAYSYNASKTYAASAVPSTNLRGIKIDDIIEPPPRPAKLKRKADEISSVTDEELRSWAKASSTSIISNFSINKLATRSQAPAQVTKASPIPFTSAESRLPEVRPTKRMKKLLENVGYAALGGVAVGAGLFSVLVATAPDFL